MSRELLWTILDELEDRRERNENKVKGQEQYRAEWAIYVAEYRG